MPGSDDEYDLVHTFNQQQAGKSKTSRPAVREVGRDNAAVQLFVGEQQTEADVRTPPSGVEYVFVNDNGELRVKGSNGTVNSPVDGQSISPSSVSTDRTTTATIDNEGSPISFDDAIDRGGQTESANTFSLSDDNSTTVDASSAALIIVIGGDGARAGGVFSSWFDTLDTIAQSGMSNEGGGTTLGGTTGPDGSLNVSRNDNTLYVENRTGSDRVIKILQFLAT